MSDTRKKTPPAKVTKTAPAKNIEPSISASPAAAQQSAPVERMETKISEQPAALSEPVPAESMGPSSSVPPEPIPAEDIEPIITEVQAEPESAPALEKGTTETMTDTAKVTESVKKAATEATNQAQAVFADINERTKAAVEKSQKIAEEFADFQKGNVEALVASAKVAAKGIETLGQDAAELGRKNFEGAQAALKSFAAVKSPTELFKLQSDYAKSSFDTFVAEASKNTEAALKLAGDIFQPLSNRLAVAAEKFKTAA
ncbi:phasin family protein [Sphingomonas sp. LaA6.9]|uniref:phasin family protein n=1 Tax=Sphingomonas sp. LaA6.9 TaxID=2919914 RepID=UPI001F4F34F6|nr:phasin family protein [Sphingomonas sp. LaA6.9]MCJ8156524.1 phasin family protein [Sphingomonas sp. LaA6.9]